MVEDIITLVKGGVLDSSTGVLVIRNPETYRAWGASLKYNPALIEQEVSSDFTYKRTTAFFHSFLSRFSQIMPIYELVRFSTAADHVGARLANLRRAWEEYMQQFHPCRCAPCRHNGIPLLTGTSCKCICKSGYQGEACEETLRRGKPIKTCQIKTGYITALKVGKVFQEVHKFKRKHLLNSMTLQI